MKDTKLLTVKDGEILQRIPDAIIEKRIENLEATKRDIERQLLELKGKKQLRDTQKAQIKASKKEVKEITSEK
jgi:multidrug resistance efflux pump